MAVEIERKFLVNLNRLSELPLGTLMKQGYIGTGSLISVRARIKGTKGFLTIKGPSDEDGLSRAEYEYEIPLEDAHQIIDAICDAGTVEKTRYEISYRGHLWELDIFHGANTGLVMAEVEIMAPDVPVNIPDWAVKEVTGDVRYYNMRLAEEPWTSWSP